MTDPLFALAVDLARTMLPKPQPSTPHWIATSRTGFYILGVCGHLMPADRLGVACADCEGHS